jgi:tRNA pseudouridine55 synthase
VVIECSSGTYVRALARDIGTALGVGGHLAALGRTRAGPFRIEEASRLTQAAGDIEIIPLDRVAKRCFTTLTISETQVNIVKNGRRLTGLALPITTTALVTEQGCFLALYRQEGPDAVAQAVLRPSATNLPDS